MRFAEVCLFGWPVLLVGAVRVPVRSLHLPKAGCGGGGVRARRARAVWPSYPGAATCCRKITKIHLI
ncbi:hypothetical protein PF004_g22674 [Phytophthora fragariae]|uniref:RxLR effector protein n=1 Tax=Phytophthora fragariae TaxID=53985 RepID=A0A6G0MZC4_9STRA|nr:hypothetical protein PF004_g22674 [Phytophthora fragariae]